METAADAEGEVMAEQEVAARQRIEPDAAGLPGAGRSIEFLEAYCRQRVVRGDRGTGRADDLAIRDVRAVQCLDDRLGTCGNCVVRRRGRSNMDYDRRRIDQAAHKKLTAYIGPQSDRC